MVFEKFNDSHLEGAVSLACACYKEALAAVPSLPDADFAPDIARALKKTAVGGIGTAAVESGKLAGYLLFMKPWENAFGTVRGSFSPLHAHGISPEGGEKLYSLLYEHTATELLKNGIYSHALDLYAQGHAVKSFVLNGFGIRCAASTRPMEVIDANPCHAYEFREIKRKEFVLILPLLNALSRHLRSSPSFMYVNDFTPDSFEKRYENRQARIFCGFYGGEPVAYLEICQSGENFTCFHKDTKNICGAYLNPGHRGRGVYDSLLAYAIGVLKDEGFKRLGVDCETLNPAAFRFWGKYFTPYTYGLVRRIDERITL